MKSDLHLHSTFSDGVMTPSQLAESSIKAGLDVIALTDHDMMDGIETLNDVVFPLRVIPGT